MTAEVAVMNKSAIALAADSAVTIGGTKIYNGAEKLFALTKHHPVGIMVYGTGNLCQVPWELIVKQYRKELGSHSFSKLEDYAENFWAFLNNARDIIPDELRVQSLQFAHKTILKLIVDKVELDASQIVDETQVGPSPEETIELVHSCCDNVIEQLRKAPFFYGFSNDDVREIEDREHQNTTDMITQELKSLYYTDDLINKFNLIFALTTCKRSPFGVNTGVVFAGYGEDEYFPSTITFSVCGFYFDKLRYAHDPNKKMDPGQSGLQAYAQEDEIQTFMSGINPELRRLMTEGYFGVLKQLEQDAATLIHEACCDQNGQCQVATQNAPAKPIEQLIQELSEKTAQSWMELSQGINAYIDREHNQSVLRMIEFLPKEDLAHMAESLVSMTAFKRKMSTDTETVGGPVDVAIISKGDGFIWVKRKHYFDKDLNAHYFNIFSHGAQNHDQ